VPADPTPLSARAQLAALVARAADDGGFATLRDLPAIDGGRPAAILILFGVLDRLESDHDARAAAVSRDLDVLLLARAATLRSHPGQVAFPGGRIDPGDDGPVAAALREAWRGRRRGWTPPASRCSARSRTCHSNTRDTS